MEEFDINHKIYGKPHHPIFENKIYLSISKLDDLIEDITYNENMKVIDRDCSYEQGSDTIFCRLNKDMFGLDKDSYIVLDFSFKNKNLDTGCVEIDTFNIFYLDDLKNKDLTEKLFKQETVKYPTLYKKDILYNTKKITIKFEVKVVLEYEEYKK